MLLSEILRDPHRALIHMQRYVNNGSKSGYHSVFPEPYDPFCHAANYPLPYLNIAFDHPDLSLARSQPMSPIDRAVLEDHEIRFYLHPLMWTPYGEQLLSRSVDKTIHYSAVCPTSSVRTVRTLSVPEALVKLHYEGVVGRIRRNIERTVTEYVSAVSTDVHSILSVCESNPPFAFLDEPIAAYCRLADNSGIGIYYRAPLPIPPFQGTSILIPGHALWSRDLSDCTQPAILTQLINELGGKPLDVLMRVIIKPYLEAYLTLATRCGLAPEAHGQNTYVEFSANLCSTRIVFQGFDSFLYDAEVRRLRGLSVRAECSYHKYLKESDSRRFEERSWYFDEKLLDYVVGSIAKRFADDFGYPNDRVENCIADVCDEFLSSVQFPYLPTAVFHQVDSGRDTPRTLHACTSRFRRVASYANF